MIIFVLDTTSVGGQHEIWEYASDLVIRLDTMTMSDYYLRTIQIVKARYQSHVWGTHQLKIYKPTPISGEARAIAGILPRQHPYRSEGGIFIYPSIHWYLSLYKRRGPKELPSFKSMPPQLTGLLKDGLPKGRCTAFIGSRGGHKSHLGYVLLLHEIVGRPAQQGEEEEAALVISLRDDEKMTLHTLQRILETEFPSPGVSLDLLQQSGRLEILYYHPGYITPEEFFHRMFISLHRLKRGASRHVTVMFNSLDQLSSRFPLCARQQIFVPGIIEALSGEGATSIFVAVDERGQPAEQYGLLPMADVILSFYPYRFTRKSYFQHLDAGRELSETPSGPHADRIAAWSAALETSEGRNTVEAIVLHLVRFAGGQKAGSKGILERVDETDLGLYDSPGLYYTPLDPHCHPGVLVGHGVL